MDFSISDIVASVTRAHNAASAVDADSQQQQKDLQLLTRAWISERVAPELLPYPAELMSRIMSRIRKQVHSLRDSLCAGGAKLILPFGTGRLRP